MHQIIKNFNNIFEKEDSFIEFMLKLSNYEYEDIEEYLE